VVSYGLVDPIVPGSASTHARRVGALTRPALGHPRGDGVRVRRSRSEQAMRHGGWANPFVIYGGRPPRGQGTRIGAQSMQSPSALLSGNT
jgi:hypothetical protein